MEGGQVNNIETKGEYKEVSELSINVEPYGGEPKYDYDEDCQEKHVEI